MKPQVMIAIPTHGTIEINAAAAVAMVLHDALVHDIPTALCFSDTGDVAGARRALVKGAFDLGVTHIMWLDSDSVPPPDLIRRLMAHDKEVVGGLYHKRTPPHDPVAYRMIDGEFQAIKRLDPALMFVEAMGQGCLLVDINVYYDMAEEYGDDLWYVVDPFDGEDIYFFRRLLAMGIPAYLDATVQCGHVGTKIYTSADWQREPEVTCQVSSPSSMMGRPFRPPVVPLS